jgi:PAS domain S-box-containing protein
MPARPDAAKSTSPIPPPLAGEQATYNEAQLRAILQTCVEGIITIDQRGIVESFNESAERIFGYGANEVIGKNVSMLMPPPDRDRHDEYIARYLATGEQRIIGIGREVMGRRKDGTLFPMHLSVSEVRYGGRRIFTGFVHDVTDLRQAQLRLIQSERLAAIGEAMAGLAHESRNALQRIQVTTEMLMDLTEGDAEATHYIGVINRAQHDLQRLFQEVREYAAPIQLAYERVPLDAVVQSAWTELAAERSGRTIDFVEEKKCDDLHVNLDPFAVRQVFRNILENSLAACGDPIEIRVIYSGDHLNDQEALTVRVRDNGPGLSAEECGRAFDSFYTTKTKGTGLGLAISKRIIEAHAGQIAANPDCPDGAEFLVMLPRRRL